MQRKHPLKGQKKQKHFYSGKKKKHTLKSRIVVDKKSHQIICTAFANGKQHDFRLFKESKTQIHSSIDVVTDSGYQGLQKIHSKTQMPKKRSKKSPLTNEDKENNRQLSRERVLNENVIGSLKRFKIICNRHSFLFLIFSCLCSFCLGNGSKIIVVLIPMSIFWIVATMLGMHLLQKLGPCSNCVQESGLNLNFIFDEWYKNALNKILSS